MALTCLGLLGNLVGTFRDDHQVGLLVKGGIQICACADYDGILG
jgi:hypothetical protein